MHSLLSGGIYHSLYILYRFARKASRASRLECLRNNRRLAMSKKTFEELLAEHKSRMSSEEATAFDELMKGVTVFKFSEVIASPLKARLLAEDKTIRCLRVINRDSNLHVSIDRGE